MSKCANKAQEQGHKDFQFWQHNWCNMLAHSMHEKEGLTQLFLFGNNPLVINFIIKVIDMPLIIHILDF
jgi:hypothetical protein